MKSKKPYSPYGLIVSAIRKIWMISPFRRQALDRCKVKVAMRKKDGTISKRVSIIGLRCERCSEVFEKLQVHHSNPVGNMVQMTLHDIIQKMFCPPEELMCVCKDCHLKEHGNIKQPKALRAIRRQIRNKKGDHSK